MRRFLYFTRVVAVAAALLPAAVARAQEPASATIPVRVPEGTTIRFRQFTHFEELDPFSDRSDFDGSAWVRKVAIERFIAVTAGGKDAQGNTDLHCKIERVLVRQETDGTVTERDSHRPDARAADDTSVGPEAWGGCTVTAKIAPDGRLAGVLLSDEEIGKAKARLPKVVTEHPFFSGSFEMTLSRDRAAAFLADLFPASRPPTFPLKAGATWDLSVPARHRVSVARFQVPLEFGRAVDGRCTWQAWSSARPRVNPIAAPVAAEAARDDVEDVGDLFLRYEFDLKDGLPHAVNAVIDLEIHGEDTSDYEVAFLARSRSGVVRLADGARTPVPPTVLTLFPEFEPSRFSRALAWLEHEGQILVRAGRPDEALWVHRNQRELVERLIREKVPFDADPEDEAALTWEQWLVTARVHEGARHFEGGRPEASLATWRQVLADPTTQAGATAGSDWFLWEVGRARLMIARSLGAAGDPDGADKAFEEAVAAIGAARVRAPDATRLLQLQSSAYLQWSHALLRAGRGADALRRGEKAIQLDDLLAAEVERGDYERVELLDLLEDVADTAIAAREPGKAALLFDRAAREVRPLLRFGDGFKARKVDLEALRDACRVVQEKKAPVDPAQALVVARVLTRMERRADAVATYEIALAGEHMQVVVNADLHDAATAAVRAVDGAEAVDRKRYEGLALAWLGELVTRLRDLSKQPDRREEALGSLHWLRDEDEGLAPIRALPAFAKLFE